MCLFGCMYYTQKQIEARLASMGWLARRAAAAFVLPPVPKKKKKQNKQQQQEQEQLEARPKEDRIASVVAAAEEGKIGAAARELEEEEEEERDDVVKEACYRSDGCRRCFTITAYTIGGTLRVVVVVDSNRHFRELGLYSHGCFACSRAQNHGVHSHLLPVVCLLLCAL